MASEEPQSHGQAATLVQLATSGRPQLGQVDRVRATLHGQARIHGAIAAPKSALARPHLFVCAAVNNHRDLDNEPAVSSARTHARTCEYVLRWEGGREGECKAMLPVPMKGVALQRVRSQSHTVPNSRSSSALEGIDAFTDAITAQRTGNAAKNFQRHCCYREERVGR